jgi:hypothetical protein
MHSTQTLEFLPVARFAPLARTNRETLRQAVRLGAVHPSAWVGNKPVFAIGDLGRVIAELKEKQSC